MILKVIISDKHDINVRIMHNDSSDFVNSFFDQTVIDFGGAIWQERK